MDNLFFRTVRGGFWVFLLKIIQELFGFLRLIIIARILAPHDFGLIGIALLAMATLETFSQTGFQAALIQKKENIRSHLDIAWTFLILRGFILFGALYLVAPYAAALFNAPEAVLIIQVVGFSFFLQAFSNIGVIYFQKELEFNKEFVYQLAGTAADFVVSLSAVLVFKNVWALVIGLLAGNAARCMASYFIHPYRPNFNFNFKKARELFGFGKWISGSSILTFLITQGDDIFTGKLLGVTALGFYQMAYKVSNMPATEIMHVISQVAFPVYSKLQGDILKLRTAYLKVMQFTAFISFPMAGLIFILTPDFTALFLGEKWMSIVPSMMVLVLWGLVRTISGTIVTMFQGVGRPEIGTKLQLLHLILLAILIYPLSLYYGILGVSLAVFFSALAVCFGTCFIAVKIIKCGLRKFIVPIIIPFASIVFAILPVWIFKIYLHPEDSFIEFFALILLFISFYIIAIFAFDRFSNYKMLAMLKNINIING